MSDRVLVYKLSLPDFAGAKWCLIEPTEANLASEMEGLSPGERLVITCAEMTQAEIDELPEFEGW